MISLTLAQELFTLKGHTGLVIDLVTHPLDKNLILSSSADGTIRLWHLGAKRFIAIYDMFASSLVSYIKLVLSSLWHSFYSW